MLKALLRGATAGAAGTTALNAATYLDMAIRARPTSSIPEKAVDKITREAGLTIPGEGQARENRLQGLGPLMGTATGTGIGVAAAYLWPLLVRLPPILAGTLIGGGAMAATDLSITRLGLTEPKRWSAADWAADAVPHLAYGLVTQAALRQLGDRPT
jgi:hypothetical protein